MSIASEITRLNNAKAAIKQSLANKGIEVSDSALLDEYPALIDSIEVGGEGGDPYYEDLYNLRTSNGTNMTHMFYGCTASSLDLSKFDTSKATNMMKMFSNCTSLTELDVSNFDTSKVTDMSFMFHYCSELTTITGLQNFDFTKAIKLGNMFGYCDSLTSLDLSTWDVEKFKSPYQFQEIINNCNSLADFYPPKNINTDMKVDKSPVLSHDSLMRIINNLMTTTSTKKLTLGATNKAKLTDEEIAIATGKGWTVA